MNMNAPRHRSRSASLTLDLALKGYEIGPASKLHIGDVSDNRYSDSGVMLIRMLVGLRIPLG